MSCFIVIRGPLGCGKTTISKRLADILNGEYISIDKILEKNNLDNIDSEKGCIPKENFIKANNIAIPRARKFLEKGNVVIFDACFYHKESIKHLVNELKYPSYVFTLKTPLEICIKRDQERNKTHGKNATKSVYKLVTKFDYGETIDVTKSLEKSIKKILSHLPE